MCVCVCADILKYFVQLVVTLKLYLTDGLPTADPPPILLGGVVMMAQGTVHVCVLVIVSCVCCRGSRHGGRGRGTESAYGYGYDESYYTGHQAGGMRPEGVATYPTLKSSSEPGMHVYYMARKFSRNSKKYVFANKLLRYLNWKPCCTQTYNFTRINFLNYLKFVII